MNGSDQLKKTPIHPLYERYGARVIGFGGWEMPVQFSGIIDEHLAVRSLAGLFDVSHMGEIWIEGTEALAAVQYLTINDATRLSAGGVQYSAMANSEGGLVDDVTVYRFSEDRFMLCVNAANTDKDFKWIKTHVERFPGAEAINRSLDTALLAIQGPKARDILGRLTYADLDNLAYYHFVNGQVAGIDTVISRTGYTGEDGFELFMDAEKGADFWEELMTIGEPEGMKPCGLGARDTLRLEMGYNLYGQDIDETTSPLEARLSWITKLDKGDFIGREGILRNKQEGIKVSLSCFILEERGIPRHDYEIIYQDNVVGRVTSGTLSPSLKLGIGMGYLPLEAGVPGTSIAVRIRNRDIKAIVVKPPFYRTALSDKKSAVIKEK